MSEVCPSCGDSIRWAVTINGDPIPLDAEPSERGTLRLESPLVELPLAVYVPLTERTEHAGALYAAHKEHRPWRRRRGEPDTGLIYHGD